MNGIDIIILICLVAAAVNGAFKGLVQQLASLIGILFGVWLSFRWAGPAGEWLSRVTSLPEGAVSRAVAFAAIFLVVAVVALLLGKLISKLLKLALLGWVDRTLGAVFAVCSAVLILGAGIVAFDAANSQYGLVSAETLDSSLLYGRLKSFTCYVFPFLKEFIFSLGGSLK